jgi:osmotically-inducible protein OsmY
MQSEKEVHVRDICRREVSKMKSNEGQRVACCATAQGSDRELSNRVRVFLAGLRLPGLRGVTVDIDCGVATVGGTVNSFHEKQLATNCCQRVAGVVGVVNEIHVVPHATFSAPPVERRRAR